MLTILPKRCARSCDATAWMQLNAPPTFVSMTACQASEEMRHVAPSCATPALLTGPLRSTTRDRNWRGSRSSNLCSNLNIGKRRRNLRRVRPLAILGWGLVSLLGAAAFGVLALARGETISAAWLLTAAVCTYAVGYRFYSNFLANRVFGLDPRRATPAERFNNGHDFVPTNRCVLFGHHFASIAGAGPLVGPVLAAQFGFLPGTLWLVIGVVLGR